MSSKSGPCWSPFRKITWYILISVVLCYSIELRYKLVRCYVWSIALYGKYLESFEMWCWRKMKRTKRSEKVTNEQALEHIGEKMTLLNNILGRKPIGSVIFWEEIASFMMALKDRWRKRKEEEEEHSFLVIWETGEDIGS